MLFRRRSRSHDSPVVQIVGDCSVQLSPTKAPKTHTRHALEETIILSPNSPNSPNSSHQRGGSSDGSYRSFNSSPDQSPVYCKEPAPERTPLSRKTGYATIRTDSTDTQPAFESDAFAVLMPTTRLPILDRPISSTKAASSTARADAFKTYQEKAQQIRERNNSQGVKVPSRIVSYDYASRQLAGRRTTSEVKVISPTPAGSFPISPPLPQHTWVKPEKAAGGQEQGSRHVHGLSNVTASRKPITETTSTLPTSPTSPVSSTSCYRIYRADATAGASRSTPSPSSLPTTITIRVKPKSAVSVPQRVQTGSKHNPYAHPSAPTTTQNSRSTSPVKSMPNFTRHSSVEGDSLFGYTRKDVSGTMAGASPTSSGSEKEKEKGKEPMKCRVTGKAAEKGTEKATAKVTEKPVEKTVKTTPKRTLTTRWPWLRPSGPRIVKPTTAPVIFAAPAAKAAPRPVSEYVDPFIAVEATSKSTPKPTPAPTQVRTPTPKLVSPKRAPVRVAAPAPASAPSSTDKFDTGFAQIKSLSFMLLKLCFVIYSVIALWFILDAVREAIHTIGVPFRMLRWLGGLVWMWAVWIAGVVAAVAFKNG